MKYIFVVVGIIFLTFGLYFSFLQINLLKKVLKYNSNNNELNRAYKSVFINISLIIFFIIGYILFILTEEEIKIYFSKNIQDIFDFIRNYMISLVYFFGSIFVIIINTVFYKILREVINISYSKDYINSIIDSLIITDNNYKIREANETFLRKFEVKLNEILNKDIFSLLTFNEDDLEFKNEIPYLCNINNKQRYVFCSVSELKLYGETKGLIFSGSDITELLQLQNQLKKERNILKKFFSPEVVESIIKISKDESLNLIDNQNDEKNVLDGTITSGVITFIDLRNSTFLSRNMKPNEFSNLLNDYINVITDKVLECGGTINKIMGDGLLITYEKENLEPYINCIYNIIIDYKNKKFHPLIEFGICSHYGNYFKGIIGNKHLLEYTILGEEVNITAKMQAINKRFNVNVLFTEFVINKLSLDIIQKYNIKKFKSIQWKKYGKNKIHIYTMNNNI